MRFGVPLTTGYFTFELADLAEGETEHDALAHAYELVMHAEVEIYGNFNMPACPGHRHAPMRLNPAHVIGVVVLP